MTKEEMIIGFKQGRKLVQEETTYQHEIDSVDELAAEGMIIVSPWMRTRHEPCKVRFAWPSVDITPIKVLKIEQKEHD